MPIQSNSHKPLSACILPVRLLSNPFASAMGRAVMLVALLVSAFFAAVNAQSGNTTHEDPKVRRQPLPGHGQHFDVNWTLRAADVFTAALLHTRS